MHTPHSKPENPYPLLHQALKWTTLTSLALILAGCQDESLSSRPPQFSSSKVIFVEDLTAAIADSAPKLRTSSGSLEDPSAIAAEQLKADIGTAASSPRTPTRGRFAQWLNPQLEVQARSASTPTRNAALHVDPLAQANNQKDPLAPITVTRGWQQQLNEERPNVIGFQKQ